jgi:hypothetical protein
VCRDLENVQKSHKKWGYKIFIFRMNSILRHSNASRSKTMFKNHSGNLSFTKINNNSIENASDGKAKGNLSKSRGENGRSII